MKKLINVLFCISTQFYLLGQGSLNDSVFTTKRVIFYGYDFSKFHLVDSKRGGQDIKKYIYALIGEFQEKVPRKTHQSWLKIDSVIYNFEPTTLLNKNIDNYEIITPTAVTIKKDSLQNIVNRYSLIEKSGIGYTIIFECFDDYKESTSVYGVFFDIPTRKILLVNYAALFDIGHINRFPVWEDPALQNIRMLSEIYLDKKRKFFGIQK